jgi:hypothetical protein
VTLEQVGKLLVPSAALERTEDALRDAGRDGYELFVLWSGIVEDGHFRVRTPHVPRQSSYKTKTGLLVRIEADALHRFNIWLYENQEMLGVQVHAHPADAYHSETDSAYPIVTTVGGYSIVAADFARRGLLCEDTAVYQLTPDGWARAAEANDLIEVI